MDIFQGQRDPLTIKWATDGSGNPFDLTEAQKAQQEVDEINAA